MASLKFWLPVFAVLNAALQTYAGVFILAPSDGSTCHGGQECVVHWLDDGISPLLSAFGVSTVGLYTGDLQLVQSIEPVDVSQTRSLVFTPIPQAGPNSDAYYIGLTSTTLTEGDTSFPAMVFSPWFSIDRMRGSFDRPFPAAISERPIPSSLTQPDPSTSSISATMTIGTLSTSIPPLPSASTFSPSFSASPALANSTSAVSANSGTTRACTHASHLGFLSATTLALLLFF